MEQSNTTPDLSPRAFGGTLFKRRWFSSVYVYQQVPKYILETLGTKTVLCFSLWHARCLGPPPAANQVLFSDGTEVLLSKDCRLVTVVDKDGKRETQLRRQADRR